MVWLIDFEGFNLSNISVKVTRETAHVLQDHYPERLGVAILYNPPKFFEPFFTVCPDINRFYFYFACYMYFSHSKKVLLCLLGTGLIVDIILNSLYLDP